MQEKLKYKLEGLHCAHCATKIENGLSGFDEIEHARIDFINQTLHIKQKSKESSSLDDKIKSYVLKIEPDVKINRVDDNNSHHHHHNHDDHDHDHHHHHHDGEHSKIEILGFFLGCLIFAFALTKENGYIYELPLYCAAYLLVGWEIALSAIKNIFRGQVFDENFLMFIATIGAFAIGEYPEGVAVMLFFRIGEYFQDLAVARSRKSITDLMDIRPDYANLLKDGEQIKVAPDLVAIGETIIVKAGEKIPLDGVIIDGNSSLDVSALTGESLPREVNINDEVISGAINKTGVIKVKTTKTFSDSTVSKILDLVENASAKKAKTENFITKFARYYTPAVVGIACLIAFVPPILINEATLSEWFYRALVFLVVSCPCALVVSIPLSFFGGVGGASRNGILVKGAAYLEALHHTGTVVFDKTGTLTKGVFSVHEIYPHGISEDELLKVAAYSEYYSNHPIAQSIKKAYAKDIDTSLIISHEELHGYGIKAKIGNQIVLVGNLKLMHENSIDIENKHVSKTAVFVAIDGNFCGYLTVGDEIKQDAKQAIYELKQLGIQKIVMLTGDTQASAHAVANELGITDVYAGLLPHQKVEILENILESSDKKTIFVGDGINDAPSLARADIGIAMGGVGSDAAIEAADVVIMNDEISKVAAAIKIAKKTNSIVWQNIIFALGVKAIIMLMGALGFATMWEAVFGDVGVALIAILNASRALKI